MSINHGAVYIRFSIRLALAFGEIELEGEVLLCHELLIKTHI